MVLMRLVQFRGPVCKPVKPGRLSACTKQVPGTQQCTRRQLLQTAVLNLIRLCRTGRLKCPLQIPSIHEPRCIHRPRKNCILYPFQHLQFRVRLRTYCIHPHARFQFLIPILPCRKLYRNIRISFFPQQPGQTHHALDPTGVIVQCEHDAAHLRILFQRAEQGSFRRTVQRQIVALPPIF